MIQNINRSLLVALALIAVGCGSNNTADTFPEGKVGETVTTESGLIYVDKVIGEGDYPTKGKQVTVHYTGKLTDPVVKEVFGCAAGRYGTTLDYVSRTVDALRASGIPDRALEGLLARCR